MSDEQRAPVQPRAHADPSGSADGVAPILRPAAGLMRRLKLSEKVSLVALLFALPVGWLLFAYLRETQRQIEVRKSELVGMAYLGALQDYCRLASVRDEGRDDTGHAHALARARARMDEIDKRLGVRLKTSTHWVKLRAADDVDGRGHEHLRARTCRELVRVVAEESKLVLDPDLDTYTMGVLLSSDLPEMLETLEDVQEVRVRDHVALQRSLAMMEQAQVTIERSNAHAAWALRPAFEEVRRAGAAFENAPSVDAGGRDALRDALWNLRGAMHDALAHALQQRVDALLLRQQLSILVASLLSLTALYLLAGFHADTKRTARQIGSCAQLLAAGGTPSTLAIDSRDELGDVVRAFNLIVSELKNDRDQIVEQFGYRVAAEHQLVVHSQALAQAKNQAEAASRAKSSFLANMSHEIRTPMTAIMGYAELLQEQNITPLERAQHIRTIRTNGEHLLQIINDILDLSKIEAGQMTLESIAASPQAIVDDVLTLVRGRAEEKGITLGVDIDYPLPAMLHTDPLRLRQILINLTSNAIKFTSQGGVHIHVRYDPGQAMGLRFDVRDTGIGMSEAQVARLFRPFTQGDESTSRRFGGTGLGLTISKRLAQGLGGDISVSSTPGNGSTFTLHLAVTPEDARQLVHSRDDLADVQPASASTAIAKNAPLHARILLAEDGPDNQRLIAYHLKKAGASVVIANNGREACELVTKAARDGCPFDLVLMDMQMPEMDGFAATQQLRREGCVLPIVALTAHAMASDKQKCLSAGCDAHASKPITAATLLATCQAWVGRTHQAHQEREAA